MSENKELKRIERPLGGATRFSDASGDLIRSNLAAAPNG